MSINWFSLELRQLKWEMPRRVPNTPNVISASFGKSVITHQTPQMQTRRHIKTKSNTFYVTETFSSLLVFDDMKLCLLEHGIYGAHTNTHAKGFLITELSLIFSSCKGYFSLLSISSHTTCNPTANPVSAQRSKVCGSRWSQSMRLHNDSPSTGSH